MICYRFFTIFFIYNISFTFYFCDHYIISINIITINITKGAKLEGEIQRYRKAFWVENPKTGRFYHISLDVSVAGPRKLYQIEVEYTGRYCVEKKVKYYKKAIIDDISDITKSVLAVSKSIKPSTLSKQEWVTTKVK